MAKFCPNCGQPTIKRLAGGRERDACPDGHFYQFAKTAIGVGALVLRGDSVLLVERANADFWTLPSGYLEIEDNLEAAVEREVREECNMQVESQGIIFVRNMIEHGDTSTMYIIFLCEADANQQPTPDMVESTQARFVAPDEFDGINISDDARWFAETYLASRHTPWCALNVPFMDENIRIFSDAKTGKTHG